MATRYGSGLGDVRIDVPESVQNPAGIGVGVAVAVEPDRVSVAVEKPVSPQFANHTPSALEVALHDGWVLLIVIVALLAFSLNLQQVLPNQLARVVLSIF